MRITWLGWAGTELEADGERLVVDPLRDPRAVFAWLGEQAADWPAPAVQPPAGGALAGLVTHLHRDHADAGALTAALAPGAPVFEPYAIGGDPLEQAAVAQAELELDAAGLARRSLAPWESQRIGPFTVTALPAVDGTGDPQVSWLIEAAGRRVLHAGDTMFHGWWWRIRERFGAPDVLLAPINGARLTFPHRRPASPLPGAMDPAQAALAADLLEAELLLPIHYGGYAIPGVYEPVPGALERVSEASARVAEVATGGALEL
jgi:L-ascorbate metabolism protein UlaG (beta-lactamase superfamily)